MQTAGEDELGTDASGCVWALQEELLRDCAERNWTACFQWGMQASLLQVFSTSSTHTKATNPADRSVDLLSVIRNLRRGKVAARNETFPSLSYPAWFSVVSLMNKTSLKSCRVDCCCLKELVADKSCIQKVQLTATKLQPSALSRLLWEAWISSVATSNVRNANMNRDER